jgi:fumarate reductase subunit C
MEARLFALQRLTAMVMAPFVFTHVGLIIYAVRGGLTAGEVLSRTQGNWVWVAFYSPLVSLAFGVALLYLGLRAVAAVGGLMP